MRNTWLVLPLTPLSPLGETMSEKTCCPNARLHCSAQSSAVAVEWGCSQHGAANTNRAINNSGCEVPLSPKEGELWTFGQAHTGAPGVTSLKREVTYVVARLSYGEDQTRGGNLLQALFHSAHIQILGTSWDMLGTSTISSISSISSLSSFFYNSSTQFSLTHTSEHLH